MKPQSPIKIFSGRNSDYLAEKIAERYGQKLGKTSVLEFSDGEFQPCFEETVRGSYVFIVQSTNPPGDNLLELLMMVDAAKRASAYKIVAVIPYFGFARQDRKDKPRVAIGAKLVANLLVAAGVDRVITMDLHADQIQGFFDVPVDHLYSSSIFLPYVKGRGLPNLTIASPDVGGSKRAHSYSKFLNCELVICHKTRKKANEVDSLTVIGNVEGRDVILVDDMIDTAGSITKAANALKAQGASSVRVIASHALLSGPAYERIAESAIEQVFVTDSIPLRGDAKGKIEQLSIAEILADVIRKVYSHQSISSTFLM